MIRWELSPFHRFALVDLFATFLAALVLSVRSRAALQLEVVALRHQLGVLQRSVKGPRLTSSDRLVWASGPIGDQHWSSSDRTPSSCGIAQASGCFGTGRPSVYDSDAHRP